VTVLEASAGTGKTYAVAGLVTRFVAEGVVPLREVLAVTFTRLATGELKDRVRARLVSTELALGRFLEAGEPPPSDDPVAALLACPGPEGDEVRVRRARLAEALATFDSATITTTHGFCHMVLGALGVWGEVAPGAVLLEDPHDLAEEVVEDLYARWVRDKGLLPFSLKTALEVGLAAVRSPGTELGPGADKADESPAGLRRRLADATRTEVSRRLVDANLLTYDGMLVRLADALDDPVRGEGARRRLGTRYRVVLVDEFQDTDLVQWDVVRQAFASGGTRLVLIGDPKQAVYAFRGADVYAYLAAASAAPPTNRLTLERNWRSDGRLMAACDALFGPLQLGHQGIVYRRAGPHCAHPGPGIAGAPVAEPLRIRWLDRHRPPPGCTPSASKPLAKKTAVNLVAEDLAADVVALLSAGAELLTGGPAGQRDEVGPGTFPDDGPPDGGPGATASSGASASSDAAAGSDDGAPVRRKLEPRDIAVLVRTNEQATLVQRQLAGAGVPAVVSGTQSVLATPAARDWLALLDALQQPASRSLAAAVALSSFFGRRAEQLASGDERVWEAVHDRLHDWAGVLRRHGVAALFAEASASERLPQRLLAELQGERRLTDLRHIAELLHGEATRLQLGPAALRAWLARRAEEASAEGSEEEELCRRLDSDRAAVQVLTVHRAKGLEFPVVYCPYLWDAGHRGTSGKPVAYHDPEDSFRRKLDVGETGDPVYDEHFALSQEEARGEDLRQMYVALSRAKHQLVLWWVPATDSQRSALGRVLLCQRDVAGALAAPYSSPPRDLAVEAALEQVAAGAPGLVSIEQMAARPPGTWQTAQRALGAEALQAMSFERDLDISWRRSSYSSIISQSRAVVEEPVGSEPEEKGTSDEPPAPATGQGIAGQGIAGQGIAGQGIAGQGIAGQGIAGQGIAGQGIASQGIAGQGIAGRGEEDTEARLRSVLSPWAPVPAGAAVGTFVHSVLQGVDFSAPDLSGALEEAVAARIGTYPGDTADAASIVAGLQAAVETSLGPLAGGVRLRDIERGDRLDELAFELPVAGGDEPFGTVMTAELGEVFSKYVPAGAPLGAYASALQSPALETTLRGYLTGSLDLVFRLEAGAGGQARHQGPARGRAGGARYFVADYKTNWLASPGEALSAWHYRPVALEQEMVEAHYALQALLYLVALHRYLRWRLPGYLPEAHLGGVVYLFVRGMAGPGTPVDDNGQPCGVFSWGPPAALVREVSDLLAGKGARA
jgi:exodeoxyribonuclease V beta subunit